MKQTRLMSLVETLTNILVGFAVSLIAQLYIFSAYGVHRRNSPAAQRSGGMNC